MSQSEIINSLIKNKRNICCLCFCKIELKNSEEFISIKDQIIVNINGDEETLVMAEILQSVLGPETYEFVASFDILCDKCIKTTVKIYTFINTSRNNIEFMTKMIDTVVSSVDATSDHLFGGKTLYLSLNPEDFTSNQFYDCRRITNRKEAAKRFTEIIKPEPPKISIKSEREKRSPNFDLPLGKIMYDESNLEVMKCKECFKVYRSICNLRSHYIRVHAPKNYKCSKCPRKFGSKAFLNVHERDNHSVYVCPECGKIFYNSSSLKAHEISHDMLIVCPDCGRTYKNKSTFKKHKENNVCKQQCRAEPSKGKYTCDHCGKKYTQKMSLRVHIQYEHGNYKAHICEWCGKKFWAQSRLKAHIVKHTKEKKFDCSICGRKFVTKESLVYHTRIHTGEKPYTCYQCDASFISASRRSEHIKRHHLGIFLECDKCDAKFTSKTSLMKHKKTHENVKNSKIQNEILNMECPTNETVLIPGPSYEVYVDQSGVISDNTYYLKVCDDEEYIT